MDFDLSANQRLWQGRVRDFMAAHVTPAQARYKQELAEGPSRWRALPVIEELKAKAKAEGLWNQGDRVS